MKIDFLCFFNKLLNFFILKQFFDIDITKSNMWSYVVVKYDSSVDSYVANT